MAAGKPDRLAESLGPLRFCVAGEIGNIERDCCPESDHAGQRRNEEMKKLRRCFELAWAAQHRPEAARFARDPQEQ